MKPAFYDLEDFPALAQLADGWAVVREEFLALDAPVLDIDRVNKSHLEVYEEVMEHLERGGKVGWLLGWDGDAGSEGSEQANPDWLSYGLVVFDEVPPGVADSMPKTVALLSRLKGIKTAALVKMKPHTFLTAHQHPELERENILQMHQAVDVADQGNYAYLNVDGEFFQHELGVACVFDGSLDHFAINASNHDRTILYLEFDRDTHFKPS
jgi:beta-hydroxylase